MLPPYAQNESSSNNRLLSKTKPATRIIPSVRSVFAAHRSILDLPPMHAIRRSGKSQPARYIARIVQEHEHAGPLNSSESEKEPGIGLDEIAEQTRREIGDHEELESVTGTKYRKLLS